MALVTAAALPADDDLRGGAVLGEQPKPGKLGAALYNSMTPLPNQFFAHQWAPDEDTLHNGLGPRVLVYCDDFTHGGTNGYPAQALQWWGLSYTADSSYTSFLNALKSQKWDLVIFASENAFPTAAVLDGLYLYVSCGGKLIAHCWAMDATPSPCFIDPPAFAGHPLWAALGAYTTLVDLGNPVAGLPDPVYWWNPADPMFTFPNSVPQFTVLNGGMYCIYGQHLGVLPGFQAQAGYTVEPTGGEAAIVVGNEGRTIFCGFADAMGGADQDTDGIPDHVELWTNMIFVVLSVTAMFDVVYADDFGRSRLCINSATGEYVYRVLSGGGMGEYMG
jgi:hypothetical protein